MAFEALLFQSIGRIFGQVLAPPAVESLHDQVLADLSHLSYMPNFVSA